MARHQKREERHDVAGWIKWFSQEKGFGFIRLEDGTEAFLPAAAACQCGHVHYGAKGRYSLFHGDKGWRVSSGLCLICPKPEQIGEVAKVFARQRPIETTVSAIGREATWLWDGQTELDQEDVYVLQAFCQVLIGSATGTVWAPTKENLEKGLREAGLRRCVSILCKQVYDELMAGLPQIDRAKLAEDKPRAELAMAEAKAEMGAVAKAATARWMAQPQAERQHLGHWHYGQDRDGDYTNWIDTGSWKTVASAEELAAYAAAEKAYREASDRVGGINTVLAMPVGEIEVCFVYTRSISIGSTRVCYGCSDHSSRPSELLEDFRRQVAMYARELRGLA